MSILTRLYFYYVKSIHVQHVSHFLKISNNMAFQYLSTPCQLSRNEETTDAKTLIILSTYTPKLRQLLKYVFMFTNTQRIKAIYPIYIT